MAGILNVLLNLPLLPAGGTITEIRLEEIMVGHCREAEIDTALLAAPDFIHGGSHIVVALLHNSSIDRVFPIPRRDQLTRTVCGVPIPVKRLRIVPQIRSSVIWLCKLFDFTLSASSLKQCILVSDKFLL